MAAAVVLIAPMLLVPGRARAESAPRITAGPAVDGTLQVDSVLTASATWTGDPPPTATWTWLRCARTTGPCSPIAAATSPAYRVAPADLDAVLRVRLRVASTAGSDEARSAATAAVAPAPAPVATPTPTATPSPMPTPAPVFDVPSAAPPPPPPVVVAAPSPSRPPLLKPFPVIRIKGVLTAYGARVTLFSVRAPRSARISVLCRGRDCPRRRFRPPPGPRRLRPFERDLRAGTRLEVAVTRRGYVGKFTVIVIRRQAPPSRSDRCLVPGAKRPVRCPAG